MAYEKLNLADGTVLKAEHLAHIEEGLENIELTPGADAVGSVFHSTQTTGTTIGVAHTFRYENIDTQGREITVGDFIISADGCLHIVRGLYDDPRCATVSVLNMVGPQGPQGPQGETGANGKTPEKGVDYFTETDKEELLGEIDAVRYTEQTLTDEQKAQARANINCGSVGSSARCEVGDWYDNAEGDSCNATGGCSHAEGSETQAIGDCSHAEGAATIARGSCSHAEGSETQAIGDCSHAEGAATIARGSCSHAEGSETQAIGDCSHAEGTSTYAEGASSHVEGTSTYAEGESSHAEGYETEAIGVCSHAEGQGTIAAGPMQHVEGSYNIEDTEGKFAHIIGNGANVSNRSNAHTVDWNGVPWFAGDRVVLGGTGMDDENAAVLMPPLVVKIGEESPSGSGVFPADKTAAEIYEAYTAGRVVFAVDTFNGIYSLERCDGVNAYFSRVVGSNWDSVLFGYLVITIDADGTATMENVIGSCLPEVTAEDNGKTLKVVDGKWALV